MKETGWGTKRKRSAEKTGYQAAKLAKEDAEDQEPDEAGEEEVTWSVSFRGDCDPGAIVSNTFTMEWPRKSGQQMEFPEMDRADFFDVAAARRKIKAAQMAMVEECEQIALGKPS